jgi:hypothetical protein
VSARTSQAHRLGWTLRTELGLAQCELRWAGPRRRSGYSTYGGWRLEWVDGPTRAQMHAEVGRRAGRFPAVPVDELGYDRNLSDLGEAVTVLHYLDRQGPNLPYALGSGLVSLARNEDVAYPERTEDPWRARAHVVLSLTAHPAPDGGDGFDQLADEARRGWPHALAWLDALAEREVPNVIDFPGSRRSGTP